MLLKEEKLKLCIGCHNDFYNGKNPYNVKECWSLVRAKVTMKKRVGINDVPPWIHQPVIKCLDCKHEDGYVLVDPKAEH